MTTQQEKSWPPYQTGKADAQAGKPNREKEHKDMYFAHMYRKGYKEHEQAHWASNDGKPNK